MNKRNNPVLTGDIRSLLQFYTCNIAKRWYNGAYPTPKREDEKIRRKRKMKMKKMLSIAMAAVMAVSLLAGCGGSGSATKMTMGTGGTAGTYYAFGGVLGQYIKNKAGIDVNVVSTDGSKANIESIASGDYQLGTVQSGDGLRLAGHPLL